MKSELIKILRCSKSKQSLKLTQFHFIDDEIESAWLVNQDDIEVFKDGHLIAYGKK